MSHSIRVKTSQLFAAGTAIGALGVFSVPAPAQALPVVPLAPACNDFEFPGSTFLLKQNSGPVVEVSTQGRNTSWASYPGGGGPAKGGISGRSISFDVHWYTSDGEGNFEYDSRFTGQVRDDGSVSGTGVNLGGGPGSNWTSDQKLKCVAPVHETLPGTVDDNKKADPPVVPPPVVAPPVVPPPAATPKQGPTVTANPGLTGVTFRITDRSGVTSQCTYSSEGYQDSFGLPANGSFDLFVPAIRQFRNRTGTVTCDNGTSANTSVFY
jgi:hypothetical protein